MIHELKEGNFVIGSGECWVPGTYDTHRTANYALRFTDEELARIMDLKEYEVITFTDLQKFRRFNKKTRP